MESKGIIYLSISETVKSKVELLKATMDKDSNDVFYSVMSEYMNTQARSVIETVLKGAKVPNKSIEEALKGVDLKIDKPAIEKAFDTVDIAKLKTQVVKDQASQLRDELAKKLGMKPEEVDAILATNEPAGAPKDDDSAK